VTQWKKTGHTFSQPVACTDGFRVITPDYGASDFVIAHEMAHIAGYISESAADTAAMMCLEKVK
jgi:Zn-dependent protease with chaperone function